MDNFREWLSDNLRYFMLGGAILVIVVVLFFRYPCLCRKWEGEFQADEQTDSTADNDQGNVPSSPAR